MELLQDKISEWKAQYKFVYRVTIAGKDYYFRTLDRADYMDILITQAKNPTAFDHDVEVVKRCLLTEINPDELSQKAGIATVIAEKIMISSGFEISEVEEL